MTKNEKPASVEPTEAKSTPTTEIVEKDVDIQDIISPNDVHVTSRFRELSKSKFSQAKYEVKMCEVLLEMLVMRGDLFTLRIITNFILEKVLGHSGGETL